MNRVLCNPIDLPYRYQDFGRGPFRTVYRESADPSVVRYRDRFYLFGSMSGGFFHSPDLASWEFVRTPWLAEGDYAPDVREVNGQLYVTASRRGANPPVFRSADPLAAGFERVGESGFPYWDPNLFQDDDGRTYLYWGCSNVEPIRGVEVDENMLPIGEPVDLITGDPDRRGWERPGESNVVAAPSTLFEKIRARALGTHSTTPYIEGAWLTKHQGRYYLQYAGPGTEYNVYSDGYGVGPTPLGPFEYSPDSPFSSKPGGFITGAGHGSTFQDAHGNWWHAATMRVSVNHHFERRIGLFPAGFDDDGVLFCNQNFGDYPIVVPDGPADPWTGFSTGWMLQSYRALATATSSAPGHDAGSAVDEDIRTWWAAGTDRSGEALTIDMGTPRVIHAIQVNLADHDVTSHKPRRPWRDAAASPQAFRTVVVEDRPARYRLEVSLDGEAWTVAHDGTDGTDSAHRLVRFPSAPRARFVRIVGLATPWGSTFAVSGLRVFGTDGREAPAEVFPSAARTERRNAHVRWVPSAVAEGYNVRYGRRPDRLYHSWQVWDAIELELPTLTAGEDYWVAVDAYNAGGVTVGRPVRIRGASA
jgi:xylan 1,4-beta-xylosidase